MTFLSTVFSIKLMNKGMKVCQYLEVKVRPDAEEESEVAVIQPYHSLTNGADSGSPGASDPRPSASLASFRQTILLHSSGGLRPTFSTSQQ